MRKGLAWAMALLALPASMAAQAQKPTMPPLPPPSALAAPPEAPPNAATRITLDEALRLAVQHNHALQAARSTILQNQAEEMTANLRPNPTLSWDSQFFPLFNPSQFSASYLENQAQFDLGLGYLFERGKKRQHRLQAAKDQTAVTRSQVADNERQLALQYRPAIHRRAAGAIDARSRQAGRRQLSANRGHQRIALQSRRHERRRSAEDQAAVAAISKRSFCRKTRARSRRWRRCASWSDSNPSPTNSTCRASSTTSRCTPAWRT